MSRPNISIEVTTTERGILRLRFRREDLGIDLETSHDGTAAAHEEERRIGQLVLTMLGLSSSAQHEINGSVRGVQ